MRSLKAVLIVGLLVMSSACATTFFNSTWVNPYTTPVELSGQKIVALMITGDETTRRSAEDTLARQITSREGRASPPGPSSRRPTCRTKKRPAPR